VSQTGWITKITEHVHRNTLLHDFSLIVTGASEPSIVKK